MAHCLANWDRIRESCYWWKILKNIVKYKMFVKNISRWTSVTAKSHATPTFFFVAAYEWWAKKIFCSCLNFPITCAHFASMAESTRHYQLVFSEVKPQGYEGPGSFGWGINQRKESFLTCSCSIVTTDRNNKPVPALKTCHPHMRSTALLLLYLKKKHCLNAAL